MGLLTAIFVLPLVGAVALAFVDGDDHRTIRFVSLVFAAAAFVAAIVAAVRFDTTSAGFQLVEKIDWIPSIGASYHLGVDGISLVLVLLTTFLTPLILLAAWNQETRVKGYFASFLVLEAAVLGAFLTLDLLLFYVFFDAMLVPMYLIIGIWGSANRRYAAVKFFLYTMLGGLLMLVAILFLFSQAGTFDYLGISQLQLSETAQKWLFLAFFVAFAVKLPLFPVHTWLPDAHTEAPTGGSVFLAAILLKIGGFGVLRYLLPLFPDASVDFAPWIIALSVVGILYGAVVALMQPDVKRLIAYSSVSHMGFVMLGLFAFTLTSASAGVVQMINHGLSTGALFLLVGFLYDRRHTRAIAAYGGLAKTVPIMAGFWLVVSLSSLALPGLNGFVGEFPILLGTFQTTRWAAVLSAFGAVLAALYLLWVYQRMFHGPVKGLDNQHTTDLHTREVAVLVPIVALIVAIGIYPEPLYNAVEPSVDRVLQQAGLSGVETADVESVVGIEEGE
ncbi:MAG: NADH-quinone oxidoreductase subunit M [Nitriliruptorales bacterium]|nr:NADH-quinone oxidoreductase subunit M [Nitriliruptorales bacterium]